MRVPQCLSVKSERGWVSMSWKIRQGGSTQVLIGTLGGRRAQGGHVVLYLARGAFACLRVPPIDLLSRVIVRHAGKGRAGYLGLAGGPWACGGEAAQTCPLPHKTLVKQMAPSDSGRVSARSRPPPSSARNKSSRAKPIASPIASDKDEPQKTGESAEVPGVFLALSPTSSDERSTEQADRSLLQSVMAVGKLPPDQISEHVGTVVAALGDADGNVRLAAMRVMALLNNALLSSHSPAIAARLDDPDSDVRIAAVRCLACLEPPALAKHAAAIVEQVADPDCDVRLAVVLALGKLKPWKLEQLAPRVVEFFHSPDSGVRYTALEVVSELKYSALEQQTAALVGMLSDVDSDVRLAAIQLLAQLQRDAIVDHAAIVVKRLEDSDADVRLTAMRVLAKLEPAGRAHATPSNQLPRLPFPPRDETALEPAPSTPLPLLKRPLGLPASPASCPLPLPRGAHADVSLLCRCLASAQRSSSMRRRWSRSWCARRSTIRTMRRRPTRPRPRTRRRRSQAPSHRQSAAQRRPQQRAGNEDILPCPELPHARSRVWPEPRRCAC